MVDDSSSRRLVEGLDNVGKINADTTRNYYLKDHLGSVRVVLNSTNGVLSAQDYDCWGYMLENRSYNAGAIKYDFTGKERDNETSYDYFGARYYDTRIANWTSIDPLFQKHFDFTPYNYVLRDPINLIDPDGKQHRPVPTQMEPVGGIGYSPGYSPGIYISPATWRKIGETIGTGWLIENALSDDEQSSKAEKDDKETDTEKEKPSKEKKEKKSGDTRKLNNYEIDKLLEKYAIPGTTIEQFKKDFTGSDKSGQYDVYKEKGEYVVKSKDGAEVYRTEIPTDK